MYIQATYNIYLILLISSAVVGLFRKKSLDNRLVWIVYLISFTVLGEFSAAACLKFIGTKSPAFHFTSIISLFIIATFFIKATLNAKNKFIFYAAIILLFVGVVNLQFQSIFELTSNTMIFRGFSVILMALYSLYRIFIDENEYDPLSSATFWIWVFLLFLYGGTYFFWSYVKILSGYRSGQYLNILTYIQLAIDIITYSGIGLVFLLFPKKVH